MTTIHSSPSILSTTSAKIATPKLATISTVTTVPPWAKDEPPSPKEEVFSTFQPQLPAADQASNSDFGHNFGNGSASGSLSRWWTFTTPRQAEQFPDSEITPIRELNRKQSMFKDKRRSWLATPTIREPSTSFSKRAFEKSSVDPEQQGGSGSARKPWDMRISMPTRPFTVNQVNSPGWETPWTSRAGAQGPFHSRSHNGYIEDEEENLETHSGEGGAHTSKWKDRKKRLRMFLLNNAYVPLLFRFINISFTTGTLAVAIRIRQVEMRNNLVGVVGSSPTLIIIFAPLTLVHVIGAIYLEYFGRPLGLWRTSAKLAHTLSEVLFICAWSAALSLCFDNFFTSLIPCAAESAISWYDTIPRPTINIPTVEGSVGDALCDSQLALICLVFMSLVMYCTNLVISLYRIFEKVKYLPGAPLGLRNR